MYQKLAISAVSVLGLTTVLVSAQQPAADYSRPQQNPGQSSPGMTPLLGRSDYLVGQPRAEWLDLTAQSEALIKQLGSAEGENKEKIKVKLTETLDKQFDLRQKRHEAEIAALEAQVKKLKEMVQKRQENRKDIIGKRLDQLLREAEGLSW
jgi:hypothetical protein